MIYKTYCATCIGVEAVTVTVEVDMSDGIGIRLVGLPDISVKESLLRMTTALMSYGFRIPGKKIIFNLAPADIRKEGSAYDLPMAVGLLAVSEQMPLPRAGNFILMGELALDGTVRAVRGALPVAVHAKEAGFEGCIFPRESALEAVDIDDMAIYGVNRLADVLEILAGDADSSRFLMKPNPDKAPEPSRGGDFRYVKGQQAARRGFEIAAAGGHSLLMVGSPGSGKSMMASCLPSILPPMTREESIQTSTVYSVSGLGGNGLMTCRPFRSPHHSASLVSLIGGGADVRPGEISLAHNGVLYLDEIAQFPRADLDALRQPLEDGKVTISRAKYKVTYPCSVMLIASMNPCPCGYNGDGTGRCKCSRTQISNYLGRISGPMMDRIDMHLWIDAVDAEQLTGKEYGESSAEIAARVAEARLIQRKRFAGENIFTNSQMDAAMLRRFCATGDRETEFLKQVIRKLQLSARAYSRILKLARTIADLEHNNFISLQNIAEAVGYRSLDRLQDE